MHRPHQARREFSALVLVHHNWIRGDKDKVARARTFDALTRAAEGRGDFLRRARHAVARKAAWVHVPPPPRSTSWFTKRFFDFTSSFTLAMAAVLLLAVWVVTLAGLSVIGVLCFGASRADVAAVWVGGKGHLGGYFFGYGLMHVLFAGGSLLACILIAHTVLPLYAHAY